MVRKMLKAFIKVTADKTHFSIDIKILTILVYHFIFRYNPPEYNIKRYATSSSLNVLHNLLYQSPLPKMQADIGDRLTSFTLHYFTMHQSIN